jgi:UDP-glucuronate 4-epimerase
VRVLHRIPVSNLAWSSDNPDPGTSKAPFKIYNIGNNQPVELLRFIEVIEQCLNQKAIRKFLPIQPGDVPETYANIDDLIRDIGYKPSTTIETGVERFVDWYRNYYKV